MNDFVIGLIVGLSIYWAIFFIAAGIKSFDTEIEAVIFCVLGGPPLWILVGVISLIRFIEKIIKRSRYKALVVDTATDVIYYTNSDWDHNEEAYPETIRWLGSTEGSKKVYQEIEEQYANYWNQKVLCISKINIRYCPKIVWKQYAKLNPTSKKKKG